MALKKEAKIDIKICVTAQHRQMLDQVLTLFSIKPDFDLNIMSPNQSLANITHQVLTGVEGVIDQFEPHRILVHGDTTTTLAASLASFYKKIPLAHIEAGLRTGDNFSPFPEEINRKLTDQIADLHFAPTNAAARNLIKENISKKTITVTGNTVIDSLLYVVSKLKKSQPLQKLMKEKFSYLNASKRLVLFTAHRRENFGDSIKNIFIGLSNLARRDDIEVVFPVHLNPNIQNPVNSILKETANIHLIEPLEYLPFIYLMEKSFFIVTDSGGIQEEAPSLGKPVLVMRNVTERPEAVKSGTVRLIGGDPDELEKESSMLLDDTTHYSNMSKKHNPYGDGKATERIINKILKDANDRS